MSRARDRADGVLHNRTHEDTDGGRESLITFKGEQSGGEISTLAQIQASHDGTSDDEKADLIFKTNDGSDGASPTEAMRIDSLSRASIGSGTSSVTSGWWNSTLNSMVSIENNGVNTGSKYVTLGITRNTNDAEAPQLGFSHSRGTTHDSKTVLQSGDSIGTITFQGADGSEYVEGARISAIVNGTPGANDMPTRLSFRVTHDGAATTTEKLRIDEHGLKFNGDTAEANALADYEEGTFTPTSDVTLGSDAVGIYRKVGKLVHVGMKFTMGASSSGSSATVGNLPFANVNSNAARAGLVISWNSNGLGAGLTFLVGQGSTSGIFYLDGSARSYSAMSNKTVYIGGTYPTAS